MKILILGAGGVGGYFGARLLQVGGDITFLVRSKRADVIRTQGLIVETPNDMIRLEPKLVVAEKPVQDFDLVMLSPKAYDLEDALKAVSNVPGNPTFLPLLNGFDHLQLMDELFGTARVMGGVVHISVVLNEEGVVKQLNDLHRFTFGTRHACQKPLADSLDRLFQMAAFDSVRSVNIEQSLWDKWTFLATVAGINTLMRAPVGEIVATQYGAQATHQMFKECCAVAEKYGYPVSEETQGHSLNILQKPNSNFTASMLRDLQSGHKTEHEHIIGSMLRRAIKAELSCPSLQLAYTQMVIREKQRLQN
jgi:2-dehydropantoate 2-reductase